MIIYSILQIGIKLSGVGPTPKGEEVVSSFMLTATCSPFMALTVPGEGSEIFSIGGAGRGFETIFTFYWVSNLQMGEERLK